MDCICNTVLQLGLSYPHEGGKIILTGAQYVAYHPEVVGPPSAIKRGVDVVLQ